MQVLLAKAHDMGLSPKMVKAVWGAIHEGSIDQQNKTRRNTEVIAGPKWAK